MSKYIILLIISILFLTNCKKKKVPDWTVHGYGYIINKNDSLPFRNTKFKIYKFTPPNGISKAKTEEDFFYTDSVGHFEFTTTVTSGLLVWPSYIDAAGYVGPPYFGFAVKETVDNTNRIYHENYETLYTTPYY